MTIKTTAFEFGGYIETPEDAVQYIEAALEEVGPEHFKAALRGVAQSKGMSLLAERSGLTRAGLYRALSDEGDPKLSTVFAIIRALGLRIRLQPTEQSAA